MPFFRRHSCRADGRVHLLRPASPERCAIQIAVLQERTRTHVLSMLSPGVWNVWLRLAASGR
eukprot:2085582-Prymnesium_polylepis.1